MTQTRTTFGKKPGGQPTRGEIERRKEAAKRGLKPKPNPITESHPDIVREFANPKPQMPTIKRR